MSLSAAGRPTLLEPLASLLAGILTRTKAVSVTKFTVTWQAGTHGMAWPAHRNLRHTHAYACTCVWLYTEADIIKAATRVQ